MPNNTLDIFDCNSVSYSFGANIQGIIPVIVEPQDQIDVLGQREKSNPYVGK